MGYEPKSLQIIVLGLPKDVFIGLRSDGATRKGLLRDQMERSFEMEEEQSGYGV